MNIQKAYKLIEEKYDIDDLFSLALFHKYSNVERIYLDEFDLKGMDLFLFLQQFIKDELEKHLDETFYVCIISHSLEDKNQFPKKEIKRLKKLDIKIPKEHIYKKMYIEDDEWYTHYLFFEWNKKELGKFIWCILSSNFTHIEPYAHVDVFFVNNELTKLINVYDDRGMDVMDLDTPQS